MRTLCDVCEKAAAILFCAADEAALCRSCDEKVHMCNKLANRHVRVGFAEPSEVPRCDICENAPAFFYCEVDGSSLCLHCDMTVHVGGKRTHGRYLLLRQKVEFLGDKPAHLDELGIQSGNPGEARREAKQPVQNQNVHRESPAPLLEDNDGRSGKVENKFIDLNSRPQKFPGQAPSNQEHGVDMISGSNHESTSAVPVGILKRELEK